MIISVHVPKTAGSSFVKALEAHFSSGLQKDYADLPTNTPQYERNRAALLASVHNAESDHSAEVACIHGHFLPLKYLLLSLKKELRFITWMRNPVERVLSHYYYWKSVYNSATAPDLHRRVVEEDWSVERFCLSPELRNLYGQFLWGFPLEYFDFIGITEFYDEDLAYFSEQYLNTDLEPLRENVGKNQGGSYQIDSSFRAKLEQFHAFDFELYRTALLIRQKRLSNLQSTSGENL